MKQFGAAGSAESRIQEVQSSESDDLATRLELAMEAGELGMWEWDLATNRMIYSGRARAIYGFPPHIPLTYEMVRDATHPDDLPFTSAQAQRSIDPEIRERQPYEYRLIWPDGSVRWVLAFGQAVFVEENGTLRATRYIGTIQDITARKQMELEVRANAEKLRLALAASKMAVWEIDTEGQVRGSAELNRILGFPEHTNPTLDEIHSRYLPGELERIQDTAQRATARSERPFDLEFQYVRPDSSVRWLWVRATTPENGDEHKYTALGVVQDITERKERERHFEFMLHELSHRSKNLLAVVQAITHHTIRATGSPEEFEKAIVGRIQALAAAHDLLLREDWRGAEVSDIVHSQLRVFADINPERITISGPDVTLQSGAAQELSICIYELTTNALKYGALSTPAGRVSIMWSINCDGPGPRVLNLFWTESGGPTVTEPKRRGFGSNVLRRAAEMSPSGGPSLKFFPDGVRWSRTWKEGDFYLKAAASVTGENSACEVSGT